MILGEPLNDLGFKITARAGEMMREHAAGPSIQQWTKPDGSKVTVADKNIEAMVTAELEAIGETVAGEETGRNYGHPEAWYTDPIDDTDDYAAVCTRRPQISSSAFSLGRAVGGRFTAGWINMPFLPEPGTFYGDEQSGSFFLPGNNPDLFRRLIVDPAPEYGYVLVTHKGDPYYIRRIFDLGFTPLRLHGAVGKSLCVVVPELLGAAYPGHAGFNMPVVGAVSNGTWAHDNAAVTPIIRGAGGFACSPQGDDVSLAHGKNGSVFANSELTMRRLLQAFSRN